MVAAAPTLPATASWGFKPLPVMQITIDLVFRDLALLHQFFRHTQGDLSGGFSENSFSAGQELDRIHNFLIGDIFA